MYDIVLIFFKDKTVTTILVESGDPIIDEVVAVCDQGGWSLDEVMGFAITGSVTIEQEDNHD